jgi:hypothetical protein
VIINGQNFAAKRTNHALFRQQQRAIPTAIIDALLDFGERRPAGDGSESVYFTKRSWRRFSTYAGTAITGYERYRHCYLIESRDGAIITAAFRH